ncbi:MAG: hypothetical protein COY53_07285 [Elusimicrobia bacterium CG_4_10_14_0_8_um_filter_37_32]|nr:MAG: hypothetical protein COY53_07285 [Elusimicrobia bacterium CG_4_10_14_0_8_um_filter_37_32]
MRELNIKFQPKQWDASELIDSRERGQYLFYGGAKGGGKSYLGRAKLIDCCLRYAGIAAVIVRKTYPELLANHIRKLFQEYSFIKNWYKAAEKTVYFPNGSTLELKHLSTTDDVYNYQGIEYDIIFLDEATQHEEEVFKILKTSLRSDPRIRDKYPEFKPFFLLTGNPGGIGHTWCKRLFIDRMFLPNENDKDYHFIQAKLWDNLLFMNANPEYLSNLQELPDDLRRAYLDGDWTVFLGQFFVDFRKEVHGIEPFQVDKEWTKIFALDWGYSPHPYHCGWYAIDGGTVYKYRELEGKEESPQEVAEQIVECSKDDGSLFFGVGDTQMWEQSPFQTSYEASQWETVSDKSIALQINDVLGKAGILMMKANKARITGWTNLKVFMKWVGEYTKEGVKISKQPRFKIFNTCKNTLKAYPVQLYDDLKPGDMRKKAGDDPCDTDRYAIMTISERKYVEVDNYYDRAVAESWGKKQRIFEHGAKRMFGKELILAEKDFFDNREYY